MEKLFLPVVGYEGHYAVSEDGVVRSLSRATPHGHQRKGVVLRQSTSPTGYLVVQLCLNGIAKTHRVHRLVAEAFVSNPNQLPDVHHRDHDKTNNRAENLRWVTPSENMNEASAAGRIDGLSTGRGRKLSIEQINTIRFRLSSGDTQLSISKDFNVSRRHINYIANDKSWTGPRCTSLEVLS